MTVRILPEICVNLNIYSRINILISAALRNRNIFELFELILRYNTGMLGELGGTHVVLRGQMRQNREK